MITTLIGSARRSLTPLGTSRERGSVPSLSAHFSFTATCIDLLLLKLNQGSSSKCRKYQTLTSTKGFQRMRKSSYAPRDGPASLSHTHPSSPSLPSLDSPFMDSFVSPMRPSTVSEELRILPSAIVAPASPRPSPRTASSTHSPPHGYHPRAEMMS